jgi:hypothetical protein
MPIVTWQAMDFPQDMAFTALVWMEGQARRAMTQTTSTIGVQTIAASQTI